MIYIILGRFNYEQEWQVCFSEGYFTDEDACRQHVNKLNSVMEEHHMTPYGPLLSYEYEVLAPRDLTTWSD